MTVLQNTLGNFVQFLLDLRDFVSAQPGDLAYHLVTLFAIQLILGVAFGHWVRHRRDLSATRLLVTGIGLMLARASLMFLAVLGSVGALASSVTALLLPLERFIEFTMVVEVEMPGSIPIPVRSVTNRHAVTTEAGKRNTQRDSDVTIHQQVIAESAGD